MDHLNQTLVLVVVVCEMDHDEALQELTTSIDIAAVGGKVQHDMETGAKVGQALLLRVPTQ